jgi:serine/threonine protein kinase
VKKIGSGGSSVLYLAEQVNIDRYVALKEMSKARVSREREENEINLMMMCKHPIV